VLRAKNIEQKKASSSKFIAGGRRKGKVVVENLLKEGRTFTVV
jgi:hypothetical protein